MSPREYNPIPLSLTEPFKFSQPLDVADARQALRDCANNRRQAREWFQRASEDAADKEREYRKARARAWLTVVGDTAKQKEDNVRDMTADLCYERDVALGVVKAAQERLEEVDAERASVHRLVDWSIKIAAIQQPEPEHYEPPIGARR